jgi:hypothetical protein
MPELVAAGLAVRSALPSRDLAAIRLRSDQWPGLRSAVYVVRGRWFAARDAEREPRRARPEQKPFAFRAIEQDLKVLAANDRQ